MCGAVSAGRLVNVAPLLTTVMMTGTSPAPASEAGSVTVTWSKPGVFDTLTVMGLVAASVVPTMSGVAMRTGVVDAFKPRTPGTMKESLVATDSVVVTVQTPPVGRVVVTANGSPVGL